MFLVGVGAGEGGQAVGLGLGVGCLGDESGRGCFEETGEEGDGSFAGEGDVHLDVGHGDTGNCDPFCQLFLGIVMGLPQSGDSFSDCLFHRLPSLFWTRIILFSIFSYPCFT